jgi:hypothetical protein
MPTGGGGGALGALGQDTWERLCSHPFRGRSSRMPCFVVPSMRGLHCPLRQSPTPHACLMLASCWPGGGLAAWQPGSLPSFLPALQSYCMAPYCTVQYLRSAALTPATWGLRLPSDRPLPALRQGPPRHVLGPAGCSTTHPFPFARLSLSFFPLLSLSLLPPPSLSTHIRGSLRRPLAAPGTWPPEPCGVPNSWIAHLQAPSLLLTTRQGGGGGGMDAGLAGARKLVSLGERKCESESSPSYHITSHHQPNGTARESGPRRRSAQSASPESRYPSHVNPDPEPPPPSIFPSLSSSRARIQTQCQFSSAITGGLPLRHF